MTNKERQKSLDKKKWFMSEKNGLDMSGKMYICKMCTHKTKDEQYINNCKCTATQEERESLCLCAKAYNRIMRA